jgi:hypothetical protein
VGEAFEAFPALGIAERPFLERGQIAFDRLLCLGRLGVDGGELLFVVGLLGASPTAGGVHGLVEEVGPLVGVQERVEDRGVELLGW